MEVTVPEYKIKFEEVKAQFPILKVCELLGLQLESEQGGRYFRGQCPFCEQGRTFRVTPDKNMCGCFKCKDAGVTDYAGDQLYLVKKIKGFKSAIEAAQWLLGDVGGKVEERVKSETFTPLDYLNAEHADVELLGFDIEHAKRIGIGFAPEGTMRGHVLIPIRLDCGTLVGYVGIRDDVILPKKWHFPATNLVKFPKTG
jgi:DNA primase